MPAPIPADRFTVWTFPTYEEWIKGTALGITKPRSSRLKKIDDALKAYSAGKDPTKLRELSQAFRDWVAWKGSGWASSERNTAAKGALFTRLDKALRSSTTKRSPAEIAALGAQEQLRRLAVHRLFLNAKVTLKVKGYIQTPLAAVGALKQVELGVKAAPKAASAVKQSVAAGGTPDVRNALESMVARMFDVQTVATVMPQLMHHFGTDAIAAAVPVFGQFKSAVTVLRSWGDVAVKAYDRYANASHAYAFSAGDPAEAFRALDFMLRTQVSRAKTSAAIATADFGTRALLTLADGGLATGPVVGAATALANLTKRIFEFACEYRESKAVNRLLADPSNLGFKLFTAKPLLGCYLLCCASDWDLINMAAQEFGRDGWMDDVELMKKDHITPVRITAHAFIEASSYEIKSLTSLAQRPISVTGVLKTAKRKLVGGKKMDAIAGPAVG